jgi:type III secretion protein F
MINPLPGSGISLDSVSQTMLTAVSNAEQSLRTTLQTQAASSTQTPTDLLVLQKQIQEWAMITQLQSTVVKEIADAAKSVIQKSA